MKPMTPPHDLGPADGAFVTLDGEPLYRIPEYDAMPPFLLSVVSASNHWLYISSQGGLTAGRTDEDHALFPYQTVDRLHRAHGTTGAVTCLRVHTPDGVVTWRPFAEAGRRHHALRRNLYKNALGSRVLFEEINDDLDLTFRARWSCSEAFGFVRTAWLLNHGDAARDVEVLDGLQDLLPPGVALGLQQSASCLTDAYKQVEVDPPSGLAIVSLTSRITDLAQPAEALRASVAWSHGLDPHDVLLGDGQPERFLRGAPPHRAAVTRGQRGAVFARAHLTIAPLARHRWDMVADVDLAQEEVARLRARLMERGSLQAAIDASLAEAAARLQRITDAADGAQRTSSRVNDAHHQANVLFNCMRGGVFQVGYSVPRADLVAFVGAWSAQVRARHATFFAALPERVAYAELLERAAAQGDGDLLRLCYEYLPISFSRRHGDPSRPWNRFAIHIRNRDGSMRTNYQGNWRDIFQNWEALAVSFPGYLESFIAKFVNASTVDGFNPYRITRDGFDWEVPEPDDPWSNIGYWGDHQIIYLLKLLEASLAAHPETLSRLLAQPIYAYAEVPYRIKPYAAIVEAPRDTIAFDAAWDARLRERVAEEGADGALLHDEGGGIRGVTLLEKLLVPLLSKVSNLVPGGGIWLNTQRPEWNDANNALAGYGLSMVTVCYVRRYLIFLRDRILPTCDDAVTLSEQVAEWLERLLAALHATSSGDAVRDDAARRRVMDALGEVFDAYRADVYAHGLRGDREVERGRIDAFVTAALELVDDTLRVNRRPDGLYHAYNLVSLSDGAASVSTLYEMLEGQVAALSSGLLSPEEAIALLDAMFAGPMYRPDQKSFMLYPDRELPRFLDKNVVPTEEATAIGLLRDLLDAGESTLVVRDVAGAIRFSSDFTHAGDLLERLDALATDPTWRAQVERDRAAMLALYERVFRHHEFTGRSGTMVAYEGLGSIYWHMVAKLLLAVQETVQAAEQAGAPQPTLDALMERYYRIRGGLSSDKTPAEYGAFPFDPHSHTPANAGAQQPGMTGQVKEEILTRFGELGVEREGGALAFRPTLLRRSEFLNEPAQLTTHDLDGAPRQVALSAGELGFTLCQVPVVYRIAEAARVRLTLADGDPVVFDGPELDARWSASVFERSGEVVRIDVEVPGGELLG